MLSGEMPTSDDDFLPAVIGILARLQATTEEHGRPMLAFLLDLAKAEAEDELRTAHMEDDLRSALKETSSIATWKAANRPDLPAQYSG
jgi:hypothetical protein